MLFLVPGKVHEVHQQVCFLNERLLVHRIFQECLHFDRLSRNQFLSVRKAGFWLDIQKYGEHPEGFIITCENHLFQGTGGSSWQGDWLPALRWETRRHCCRRPYFLLLLLWRHQWTGKSHNKRGLLAQKRKYDCFQLALSFFSGKKENDEHW